MTFSRSRQLFISLIALGVSLVTVAEAKRPYQTEPVIVGECLQAEPNNWPWPITKIFIEHLPDRLSIPLSRQPAESIGKFVVRRQTPFEVPGLGRVNICVASTGEGGSYVCVIAHAYKNYSVVWDSLMPPSIVFPEIEFVDVNGDSVPELLFSGPRLKSRDREWGLVTLDSNGCRVLAPRLDVPAESPHHNRLIGSGLKVLDSTDTGTVRLLLWRGDAGQNWITTTDASQPAARIFRYHADIGGYLADD